MAIFWKSGKAGSCILCVSLDPFQAELVRKRIHFILDSVLSLEFCQDRIIKFDFDEKLEKITVSLENVTGSPHCSTFNISGSSDYCVDIAEGGRSVPFVQEGDSFAFSFSGESAVITFSAGKN